MDSNTPHDPSRPPAPPHISTVRSALREAVGSATELADLLAAGLTADDQQRRAVTGNHNLASNDGGDR